MYLTVATRPDIALIVSKLSQFLDNPSPMHWNAGKRVLKYIKGTIDYGILYGKQSSENQLIAYGDADYAADDKSRRSTSGVLLLLNNSPIVWMSRKQSTVATSTTEAEYIAACHTTKEVVWVRILLNDLGFTQIAATVVNCDNVAAKLLVENPVYHRRTKHVDIQYHYTREKFDDCTIVMKNVSTNHQFADILTKSLPPDKFTRIRSLLSLSSN